MGNLGVETASRGDSRDKPRPTASGFDLLAKRTVLREVLADGALGRNVDRSSSSSPEEYGFSGAVRNDSVRESAVALDGIRSASQGRGFGRATAGPAEPRQRRGAKPAGEEPDQSAPERAIEPTGFER